MHERDVPPGTLAHVAENVWIVDDQPLKVAGLRLPIRMTIIRLTSGDLLLHSPTRYSSALRDDLERLGPIKYLLAPSIAHWMFVPAWQRALPDALMLAVGGLGARKQVRESGLRIDRELFDGKPEEWAEEIETVHVAAPLFAEIALFHTPSLTLVLTDLVQNLRPEELPYAARIAGKLLGITAPDGQAPLYLRLLLRFGGRAPELAGARLIGFAPDRVIFAHGDWFKSDATDRLRRSLRWLTSAADAHVERPMPGASTGTRVVITGASSGVGWATRLVAFAGLAVFTLGTVALVRRRCRNSA